MITVGYAGGGEGSLAVDYVINIFIYLTIFRLSTAYELMYNNI